MEIDWRGLCVPTEWGICSWSPWCQSFIFFLVWEFRLPEETPPNQILGRSAVIFYRSLERSWIAFIKPLVRLDRPECTNITQNHLTLSSSSFFGQFWNSVCIFYFLLFYFWEIGLHPVSLYILLRLSLFFINLASHHPCCRNDRSVWLKFSKTATVPIDQPPLAAPKHIAPPN